MLVWLGCGHNNSTYSKLLDLVLMMSTWMGSTGEKSVTSYRCIVHVGTISYTEQCQVS